MLQGLNKCYHYYPLSCRETLTFDICRRKRSSKAIFFSIEGLTFRYMYRLIVEILPKKRRIRFEASERSVEDIWMILCFMNDGEVKSLDWMENVVSIWICVFSSFTFPSVTWITQYEAYRWIQWGQIYFIFLLWRSHIK